MDIIKATNDVINKKTGSTVSASPMATGALAASDVARTDESYEAYAQWEDRIHSLGLRTTSNVRNNGLYYDFADYGAVLDEELQKELTSFFAEDSEVRDEAIEAQMALAGIYKKYNKADLPLDVVAREMRALGYEVDWESVKTQYIIDNKKSASHGGGELTTGNITVLTFKKDGKEVFKVADTNGNAALEIEEVFMNELLTGVVSELDPEKIKEFASQAGSSGYAVMSVVGDTLDVLGLDESAEEFANKNMTEEEKATLQTRQDAFNQKYGTLINQGYDHEAAVDAAMAYVKGEFETTAGIRTPKVTGSFDDEEITLREEKIAVTQEEKDKWIEEQFKYYYGYTDENGVFHEGMMMDDTSRNIAIANMDYSYIESDEYGAVIDERYETQTALMERNANWLYTAEESGCMDEMILKMIENEANLIFEVV